MRDHFPGPWFLSPQSGLIYGFNDNGTAETLCYLPPKFDRRGRIEWNHRTMDNGRLIQAAPDLHRIATAIVANARMVGNQMQIPDELWSDLTRAVR